MKRTAALLLGLVWTAAFAAGMQVEVISLQHRLVDDVIPVIRPLVTPGGTVTGTGSQLVVKSTPGNIADIKRVLDGIDRARRRLLITVRQDVSAAVERSRQSVSGTWHSGDVTVSGDSPRVRDGAGVAARDRDGNRLEYHGGRRSGGSDHRNTYQVQTLEGSPAFIRAGSLVPVPGRTTVVTPGAVIRQDTVDLYDATSGFYVLPRLHGDTVTLLVAPRLANDGARGFDVQNVETTVSGRLGEWLRIGGIDQARSSHTGGLLSESRHHGQGRRSVLIRVEELDRGH